MTNAVTRKEISAQMSEESLKVYGSRNLRYTEIHSVTLRITFRLVFLAVPTVASVPRRRRAKAFSDAYVL